MRVFRILALLLFGIYLAVLPGSTLTVALDRVPAWGEWIGGALLIGQGAAVLCWLLGGYGRRGALVALLVFLMAWGVEHVGVTSGMPFGRYSYTSMLQPQFFGVVPLAIACAWLMVAIGAWQLAASARALKRSNAQTALVMATLVVLLDLQIETVATKINPYWAWRDHGPYYGVPTANFVAWWLVGLAMTLVVARALGAAAFAPARRGQRSVGLRLGSAALRWLPATLYLLNTLMFTVVNLARGYGLAGFVGAATLLALGMRRLLPYLAGVALARPPDAREAE